MKLYRHYSNRLRNAVTKQVRPAFNRVIKHGFPFINKHVHTLQRHVVKTEGIACHVIVLFPEMGILKSDVIRPSKLKI